MSGKAMTILQRRMMVDVAVHGFCSGFCDWSTDGVSIPATSENVTLLRGAVG